jgi:hypothetical protein
LTHRQRTSTPPANRRPSSVKLSRSSTVALPTARGRARPLAQRWGRPSPTGKKKSTDGSLADRCGRARQYRLVGGGNPPPPPTPASRLANRCGLTRGRQSAVRRLGTFRSARMTPDRKAGRTNRRTARALLSMGRRTERVDALLLGGAGARLLACPRPQGAPRGKFRPPAFDAVGSGTTVSRPIDRLTDASRPRVVEAPRPTTDEPLAGQMDGEGARRMQRLRRPRKRSISLVGHWSGRRWSSRFGRSDGCTTRHDSSTDARLRPREPPGFCQAFGQVAVAAGTAEARGFCCLPFALSSGPYGLRRCAVVWAVRAASLVQHRARYTEP